MSEAEKRLYYMSELKDYRVNKEDFDIRGWILRDLDNRIVGEIDDFLVNLDLGKVVYVDVKVDQSIIETNHDPYAASPNSELREFINKDGENHIIIPVGLVNINRKEKYAYTRSINYQTFADTKRYQKGTTISRTYEEQVMESYDRRKETFDTKNSPNRSKQYTDAELADLARQHPDKKNAGIVHEENREQIKREKARLRNESNPEEPMYDDYEAEKMHRTNLGNMRPERSLDDDSEWLHEDHGLIDTDPHVKSQPKKRVTDKFYDRKEFR
ncbi:hypothetical protein MKO06_09155 [Gramella sp. GC03-9]|uniref:PRC-barrel domain-containing protein n=1 Tax=Christiangramia oceanisediminis TaxID=2920386 RepID=A0A9X2I2K6_9FLAO|nr:hypothetical protein [Gramella oceanisediminis]MCP9200074.1 hypothetical protein [Gramella oceanisediminis]